MKDPDPPGKGRRPTARDVEPAASEEFGLVQAWWGDGKGKTTAALGMAFRAAGHGFRVHVLQFMKGGADSVESKPDRLELVLTGSHERPDYLAGHADLVSEVRKESHPIDAGQRARRGTEY